MATIYIEKTVDTSPDELWNKVKDTGNISALLDVVTKSAQDGDVRTCTLADGGVLEEIVLGVDDAHRRVAYTITRAPFPLEFHAASMQVSDAGGGRARFVWATDVKPDPVADSLRPMFEGEADKLVARYAG